MRPAADLLMVEAAALRLVLDRHPVAHLERDSTLPGWRVRDVLAHCGAALSRLVAGDQMDFTPEANQIDVDERSTWPIEQVVEELFAAYPRAAEIIDRLDGLADGLALGEWVHGGDIRQPLGEPDAYRSDGIESAVPLLVERSNQRAAVSLTARVDRVDFAFGAGPPAGVIVADGATFVRLCAGRTPDPGAFELTGAEPEDLRLFS